MFVKGETKIFFGSKQAQSGLRQGVYKDRVKKKRQFFGIPALLSWEHGNPEQENSK